VGDFGFRLTIRVSGIYRVWFWVWIITRKRCSGRFRVLSSGFGFGSAKTSPDPNSPRCHLDTSSSIHQISPVGNHRISLVVHQTHLRAPFWTLIQTIFKPFENMLTLLFCHTRKLPPLAQVSIFKSFHKGFQTHFQPPLDRSNGCNVRWLKWHYMTNMQTSLPLLIVRPYILKMVKHLSTQPLTSEMKCPTNITLSCAFHFISSDGDATQALNLNQATCNQHKSSMVWYL
jgi:hypothetical protein